LALEDLGLRDADFPAPLDLGRSEVSSERGAQKASDLHFVGYYSVESLVASLPRAGCPEEG